jgi:hypothetical protein
MFVNSSTLDPRLLDLPRYEKRRNKPGMYMKTKGRVKKSPGQELKSRTREQTRPAARNLFANSSTLDSSTLDFWLPTLDSRLSTPRLHGGFPPTGGYSGTRIALTKRPMALELLQSIIKTRLTCRFRNQLLALVLLHLDAG